MRSELPTQAQIIEELADRVAAQIDQRRPVAFDGALEELVRYHRFLLGLGASTTPEGAPFNYAEVAGGEWHPPHRIWTMQYRRLFDLAAERIPESDHFLGKLVYTLVRLLRLPEGLVATRAISESVLDLFPSLMHAVEAWVTRRVVSVVDDGADPGRRLALAGSDAKAHAAMLRRIVGAWESLLTHSPLMSDAANTEGKDETAQWAAVQRAWPFVWNHLLNTAYCLALCVWNEDDEGAVVFREALVRWPENYRFLLPDAAYLRRPELLFPDLLEQNWAAAQQGFAAVAFSHHTQVAPGALFATALDGVHDDVLQLVADLLTLWVVQERPAKTLAAKTALELLAQVGAERHGAPPTPPPAGAVLLRFLRLQMAGGRHRGGSYGARLDALVQLLDRLTERDVVAGRIYTPTTIHDRDETLWADVALFSALMGNADRQATLDRVRALAENDGLLPRGDRSLRDILYELSRYKQVAADRPPSVLGAIEKLGSDTAEAQLVFGAEMVAEIEKVIAQVRLDRLRALPVDPARLETWRAAAEANLLDAANLVSFPSAVLETADALDIGQLCTFRFPNYPKARLTDPMMEDLASNEIEVFSARVAQWADDRTFGVLNDLDQTAASIAADPLDPAFWISLRPLVAEVGPAPRLMLPHRFHHALIDVIMDHGTSPLAELTLVNGNPRRNGYLCQIDGIDVYIEPLDPYRALLFSGERLQRLRYGALEGGGYVRVAFEPNASDDDVHGFLEFQFRQEMTWNETPIFEIALPRAPEAPAE